MRGTWRDSAREWLKTILAFLLVVAFLCGVGVAGVLITGAALFHALVTRPTMTPLSGYTPADLQRSPAGQLRYPGAVVRSSEATETTSGMGTRRAAEATVAFGAFDDQDAVRRWYDTQLRAAGWSAIDASAPPAFASSGDVTFAWEKPGLYFLLRFASRSMPTPGVTAYPTSYTAELRTVCDARC